MGYNTMMSNTLAINSNGSEAMAKIASYSSVDVLARIPEHLGEKIYFSNTQHMVVKPEMCDCGNKAVAIIRGETDSFGFEPLATCQTCLDATEADGERYLDALDVEDIQAPEGMTYLFSACTNYDGHGEWVSARKSYRAIMRIFRRAEDKAAPWGGLYPIGAKPELVTEKEATSKVKAYRDAIFQETEEFYSHELLHS